MVHGYLHLPSPELSSSALLVACLRRSTTTITLLLGSITMITIYYELAVAIYVLVCYSMMLRSCCCVCTCVPCVLRVLRHYVCM